MSHLAAVTVQLLHRKRLSGHLPSISDDPGRVPYEAGGPAAPAVRVRRHPLVGAARLHGGQAGSHGLGLPAQAWLPDCYIARFLDCMCLALRASGLGLRFATLQNLIPSFP